MIEILNLIFPFFSTPKNYDQMLKKLAMSVFYETYVISFFLRNIPEIDNKFRAVESYGNLGSVISEIPHSAVINVTGFAIALAAAIIAYMLPLHDKISDVFGIRKRFDREKILIPLALLVGVALTDEQIAALKLKRDSIMRKVFYKYASSRADNPLVDKHDIEHALGAWFWLWLLIEAATIFLISSLPALYFTDSKLGLF